MSKTITLKQSVQVSESLHDHTHVIDANGEYSAGPRILKSIMDYSRSLHVQRSKMVEHVEVILN